MLQAQNNVELALRPLLSISLPCRQDCAQQEDRMLSLLAQLNMGYSKGFKAQQGQPLAKGVGHHQRGLLGADLLKNSRPGGANHGQLGRGWDRQGGALGRGVSRMRLRDVPLWEFVSSLQVRQPTVPTSPG